MKILGVVGGIGPESTIIYYRMIVAAGVPVIIDSIDLQRLLDLVANDRQQLAAYLGEEIDRLARAGAEIALIAANTPHLVFDEVQRRAPIPLVSIVDATVDEAKKRGYERVALFGTRFTMQADFYRRDGVEIVAPNEDEQSVIHGIYTGELLKGIVRPESRAKLLAIVDDIRARRAIDAVILGGTELSLILHDGDAPIPLLDTTEIHVAAAIGRCRAA